MHKQHDVKGSSPVKVVWSELLGSGGLPVVGALEEDSGGGEPTKRFGLN